MLRNPTPQPQRNLYLVFEERVFLFELIFAFRYAGSSIENAREQFVSCIHVSFTNFAIHPISQTKI